MGLQSPSLVLMPRACYANTLSQPLSQPRGATNYARTHTQNALVIKANYAACYLRAVATTSIRPSARRTRML